MKPKIAAMAVIYRFKFLSSTYWTLAFHYRSGLSNNSRFRDDAAAETLILPSPPDYSINSTKSASNPCTSSAMLFFFLSCLFKSHPPLFQRGHRSARVTPGALSASRFKPPVNKKLSDSKSSLEAWIQTRGKISEGASDKG